MVAENALSSCQMVSRKFYLILNETSYRISARKITVKKLVYTRIMMTDRHFVRNATFAVPFFFCDACIYYSET